MTLEEVAGAVANELLAQGVTPATFVRDRSKYMDLVQAELDLYPEVQTELDKYAVIGIIVSNL